MIETVPLEHAAEAYNRMMEGKARFRMVILRTPRMPIDDAATGRGEN
jgi:hypothetical protein